MEAWRDVRERKPHHLREMRGLEGAVTRSSRKLSPRIVSYVKESLSPSDRPKSAHVHTVYAVCT